MISDKLQKWITVQSSLLRFHFPTETKREEILARLAKIIEEVGELADKVLASSGKQRKEKLDSKEHDALSGEFADVFITTLLLAEEMEVDVSEALEKKIQKINDRFERM